MPILIDENTRVIFGRVGRRVQQKENLHPDEQFEEFTRETWRASIIIIDPRRFEDGQKIAFEEDSQVGKPSQILERLISLRITKEDIPFEIDINPLMREANFYRFIKENRGLVTSLKFVFSVPNMFGGADTLQDELRSWRDGEQAKRVVFQVSNPNGLQAETDRLDHAAKYATQGGGVITGKAMNGKSFDSRKNREIVYVEEGEIEGKEGLIRK